MWEDHPCQGFSNANRQRNSLVNLNNQLTKAYVTAVQEINPKAFVLENVGMLTSDRHMFMLTKNEKALVEELSIDLHYKKVTIEFSSWIKPYIHDLFIGRFKFGT